MDMLPMDIPAIYAPAVVGSGPIRPVETSVTAAAAATGQSPFSGTPISIPGLIQAENFDNGGEGVAYHDTTGGNSGGAYRSTDVDIQGTTDTGGGYNVGWTKAGEWLEYTVNVPATGLYTIQIRVASNGNGGKFHVEFNGVNKTGSWTVPNTGGWQKYQTLTINNVSLSAGQQVMRLAMEANGGTGYVGNFNWVKVGSPAVRTPNTWITAAFMPVALGEVAGGIINGKIYAVGEGNSGTFVYNIATDTWSGGLAVRPFVGHHHAAEVYNGKLYLIGGLGGNSYGKVQIFDPATNKWTLGANMPFAAGSSSTALINGQIYAAGGILPGNTTTNKLARYNPATNTWTNLKNMPQGRNHAASATDGANLYIFGGRTGGNTVSNGFNTVQIYNPTTNNWVSSATAGSTIAPLPQARGGMGKAVYFNGEFYIIGGETSTGAGATADKVYNRVDIYKPATNTWRLGPAMPTARHGIFPLLYNGAIYVFGGGTKSANSQSPILEVLYLT